MATVNKIMKTFNVPNGNDVVCYEIVDDKGRKAIAKDWESNSTAAFAVGEYTMKDGVVYRFKVTHQANTAWNASEVDATNLGAELTSFHGDMKALDGKKANADSMFLYKSAFPGSVVEVEDAVAECVKQMQIEIAPVQDLHGYDKPWVGGAGKNLLNINGSYIKRNVATTVLQINGDTLTVASSTGQAPSAYAGFIIPVTVGSTYVFSYDSLAKIRVAQLDEPISVIVDQYGSDVNSGGTVTASKPYLLVNFSASSAVTFTKPQVELGSTPTSYEPYSNICPISGHTGCEIVRTGKNLLNEATRTNGYYIAENGYTSALEGFAYSALIPVKAYEQYTFSLNHTNSNNTTYRIHGYDKNGTWIKQIDSIATGSNSMGFKTLTLTIPNGVVFVRISYAEARSDSRMFEVGKYATDYIAFEACNTYSIQFPSPTPGTVYGGTLTLNQDGTGTLVVDRLIREYTGDDNWIEGSTQGLFIRSKPSGTFNTAENISDSYEYIRNSTQTIASADYNCFKVGNDLNIRDLRFTTLSDFKNYVTNNHITICFKTSSTATYTLTIDQVHLLLGYNTLYASTGSILSMLYPTSQVEAVANAKADGILESSSTPSAVMSFSDGADGIPMGVEVAIEPVQDLHGYDKPWVGGAGKNLLPTFTGSSAYNVTATVQSDGSVKVSGTPSSSDIFFYPSYGYITIPAGTYTVTGGNNFGKLRVSKKVNESDILINHETGNGLTFTLTDSTEVMVCIRVQNLSGVAVDTVVYPMLRISTTEAGYEPYENICPISGFDHAEVTRTGKNLFNKIAAISNRYIDRFNNIASSGGWNVSDYIPVIGGKNLVLGGFNGATGYSPGVCWYDEKKQYISGIAYLSADPVTFTVANSAKFVRISFNGSSTNTLQLEYGTTPTAYEPFGQTYSITFPTSAGTVYGGTLKVNKDGSGVLVVDRAFYTIPQITQDMIISSTTAGSTGLFVRVPTTGTINGSTDVNTYYAKCSVADARTNATRGGAWTVNAGGEGYTNVWVPSDSALADLNEKLQGQQIVSTLKTKSTYTIPAPIIKSLLGQNNLWSSTGNVNSAEWSADTKSYIDNLFSSITSAEGQTF